MVGDILNRTSSPVFFFFFLSFLEGAMTSCVFAHHFDLTSTMQCDLYTVLNFSAPCWNPWIEAFLTEANASDSVASSGSMSCSQFSLANRFARYQ